MNFQIINPSEILSKYIKHYWMLETSANEGVIKERVIPTGNIDLIFHYAKTLIVQKPNGTEYQQAPFLLSGQNSSYVDVVSSDKIGMIAVVFYPHTAGLFFNFPLNIIENQSVCLRELLKEKVELLEEKIAMANNLQSRVEAIENFLFYCLHDNANKQLELIVGALKIINQYRGQINSTQLANNLGISKKQLERKFANQIGKSPKKFIKIVRFQSVLDRAKNMNEEKLSTLAYDNGYFDQAHFIHDFKSHTGYTPKEFFKLYDGGSDYYG